MPSPDNRLDEEATPVPELANLSLKRVLSSTNSALDNAVARAVAEAARGSQNFAAHGSSPVVDPTKPAENRGLGKR